MIRRIEESHFYVLGRIFIPKKFRRRACEEAGKHRPVLVEAGMAKLCLECGTW